MREREHVWIHLHISQPVFGGPSGDRQSKMIEDGWAVGFFIASVVGWGAAFAIAAFSSVLISAWSGKRDNHRVSSSHHHHHRSSLLSIESLTGMAQKTAPAIDKVLHVEDTVASHDRVMSSEMTYAVYFAALAIATLLNMIGTPSIFQFGLGAVSVSNLYSFFGVFLIVCATQAVFASSASVGGALPIMWLSSTLTGVLIFLLACTGSGDYGTYGSLITVISLSAVTTIIIGVFAAREKMTIWRGANFVWYGVFIFVTTFFVLMTFSWNLMNPLASYRIVAPFIFVGYGYMGMVLSFIASVSSSDAPSKHHVHARDELDTRK